MKYSVGLLFALAVAGSLSTGDAAPQYGVQVNYLYQPIPLGTLFQDYIFRVILTVVEWIEQILLRFVPGNYPLPLEQMLEKLSCVPNPTLGVFFTVLARVLNTPHASIAVQLIPVAITNTPLDVSGLVEFVAPILGSGAPVPFGLFARYVGQFLAEYISADLVGLFNRLPRL